MSILDSKRTGHWTAKNVGDRGWLEPQEEGYRHAGPGKACGSLHGSAEWLWILTSAIYNVPKGASSSWDLCANGKKENDGSLSAFLVSSSPDTPRVPQLAPVPSKRGSGAFLASHATTGGPWSRGRAADVHPSTNTGRTPA
jgi:hypothetical protein